MTWRSKRLTTAGLRAGARVPRVTETHDALPCRCGQGTLGDDLDELALLERREQILAKRLDKAKQARGALERAIYDRMLDEGWEPNKSGFNRNGFKFRPTFTTFAIVQDATQVKAYLESQEAKDNGHAGLVEDKFKMGELNRIVRRKIENGEPLPPGLGHYDRPRVAKSGIMDTKQEEADDRE
jgi:hypothetical protein